MKSLFALYGALVLVGGVLGWQLHNHLMEPASVQYPASASSSELIQLQDRVTTLENELADEKTRSSEREVELEVELAKLDSSTSKNTSSPPVRHLNYSSMPSLDNLTRAGIPLATAQAIRDQISQQRMSLLQLRDSAERGGWLNTPRYAQALRKQLHPGNSIREQFGDDIYDRYLYATGRPNRVEATVVYPNSAADAAGVQAGDIILSYASQNIYSMRDLQQATVKGQAGESVLMVLERNGSSFSITVPRGPLGIELKMKSEKPEDN